jgi:hypothetical protein
MKRGLLIELVEVMQHVRGVSGVCSFLIDEKVERKWVYFSFLSFEEERPTDDDVVFFFFFFSFLSSSLLFLFLHIRVFSLSPKARAMMEQTIAFHTKRQSVSFFFSFLRDD